MRLLMAVEGQRGKVRFMPECHSCSHNGLSWLGCLRCKGPSETNHKGQTFVSIDAGSGKLTRQRSGSANGQTFGEMLASTEAIDGHEPDALDLDTGMNADAADCDLDRDGEKAAFESAECFEVEPDPGCDPHAAAADPVAGLATSDPEHGAEPEPDSPLAMARKLAFVFTELTTEEFDLVRRLMRGENMADIGRASGVTRACVSARVRNLARQHPAFLFLRNANGVKSVVWPYHVTTADGRRAINGNVLNELKTKPPSFLTKSPAATPAGD